MPELQKMYLTTFFNEEEKRIGIEVNLDEESAFTRAKSYSWKYKVWECTPIEGKNGQDRKED